jgi:hypothetical protein
MQRGFYHPTPAGSFGDTYYEVKLTSPTVLQPGATSSAMILALHHSDWSAFDQPSDWSFAPTSSIQANSHVTLHDKGQLVWGVEPPIGCVDAAHCLGVTAMPGEIAEHDGHIRPTFYVVNHGTDTVPLNELAVRYWLTGDTGSDLTTWCDWADVGCANVHRNVFRMAGPKAGADAYVEIGFTHVSPEMTLAPGAQTLVKLRVTHEDWANFDETNDYSFAAVTAMTANKRITVYRNGRLVWGVEPAQAAQCSDPAHCVKAQHMPGGADSHYVNPLFNLVNASGGYVPMSELTVRYWFTSDGSSSFNTVCDMAWMGYDKVLRRYGSVSPARTGADTYMELGFAGSSGVLAPGQGSGPIAMRASHTNGSTFNQSNDYSYVAATNYADNAKVSVYRNGVLIWGVEP